MKERRDLGLSLEEVERNEEALPAYEAALALAPEAEQDEIRRKIEEIRSGR